MGRGAPLAVALAALALAGTGCGNSGATGQTTVQRYDLYPPDTISVPAGDPESQACRRDAGGLGRASAGFVAHSGPESVYPADLSVVLVREELADFGARRCDQKLLGHALVRALSRAQRRVLVTHLPHPFAAIMRGALAAVGG